MYEEKRHCELIDLIQWMVRLQMKFLWPRLTEVILQIDEQVLYLCTQYKRYVTSSNDMMPIKLFAFFLLFKNSEACDRSSLDNIFYILYTRY
jgi:hypothetical protein